MRCVGIHADKFGVVGSPERGGRLDSLEQSSHGLWRSCRYAHSRVYLQRPGGNRERRQDGLSVFACRDVTPVSLRNLCSYGDVEIAGSLRDRVAGVSRAA